MQKNIRSLSIAVAAGALLLWGAATHARILQPGESVHVGGAVHSENGRYVAHMQSDGNFVVYRNDGSGHAIWSTGTRGSNAQAVMQRDGNFVIYDGNGKALWWTASNGRDRTFTVTEFGQAMVIAPGKPKRHIWGPGTELLKRLRVKPVWMAPGYDGVEGRRPKGPHCVGDPHRCFGG
jgi:hypothetical protein